MKTNSRCSRCNHPHSSGKLWLVQKLKVRPGKHPQGFREGGVRGGRELGHLRGKAPWPLEAHFVQKLRQSRFHELPLPNNLQKDDKKCWQGCHIGRFIEILIKNETPRTPKWSKSQYSHHNIAIFTSCPKSPKWCHMVPKGLQNESLGPPKCCQVVPQGSPGVPKVFPNVQKDHLGKLPGTQVGPKVAQVPSRPPFLSGF